MTARDGARTLELVIRGAMAEERLLGARLDRLAESQQKTRVEVERELRHERFGQPPEDIGNSASPPPGWPRRTAAG